MKEMGGYVNAFSSGEEGFWGIFCLAKLSIDEDWGFSPVLIAQFGVLERGVLLLL